MNGQECPFEKTEFGGMIMHYLFSNGFFECCFSIARSLHRLAETDVSNGEFPFMPLSVAICHSLFDIIVDNFGVLV